MRLDCGSLWENHLSLLPAATAGPGHAPAQSAAGIRAGAEEDGVLALPSNQANASAGELSGALWARRPQKTPVWGSGASQVLEPLKQVPWESQNVIISSQLCGSKIQRVLHIRFGIPIAWCKARVPELPRKSIREGASSFFRRGKESPKNVSCSRATPMQDHSDPVAE